jgi:hypothetical protein
MLGKRYCYFGSAYFTATVLEEVDAVGLSACQLSTSRHNSVGTVLRDILDLPSRESTPYRAKDYKSLVVHWVNLYRGPLASGLGEILVHGNLSARMGPLGKSNKSSLG